MSGIISLINGCLWGLRTMFAGLKRMNDWPASAGDSAGAFFPMPMIVLVFTLVATAIVGFVHMSGQQRATSQPRHPEPGIARQLPSPSPTARRPRRALLRRRCFRPCYPCARQVAVLQGKSAAILDQLRPISVAGAEPCPARRARR